MPTNNLILSTSWNARRHTNARDMVNEIKSLGFDKIELSFNLTKEMVEEVKNLIGAKEAEITSVHNFCPIPDGLDAEEALPDCYSLASTDEEERKTAVKYTKRTIDTAAALEAKAVILHCGRVEMFDRTKILAALYEQGEQNSKKYREEKETMTSERDAAKSPHLESLKRTLDELIRYAEKRAIKLAIENRYYFGEIPSFEEIGVLLKDHPLLFYWHDVGHAQNMENLGFAKHEDYLARYAKRAIGFHIHNIAGTRDHLSPQSGEYDLSKLTPYFRNDTLLVIESHHPATAEQIREGRIYVEKLFTGAKR